MLYIAICVLRREKNEQTKKNCCTLKNKEINNHTDTQSSVRSTN